MEFPSWKRTGFLVSHPPVQLVVDWRRDEQQSAGPGKGKQQRASSSSESSDNSTFEQQHKNQSFARAMRSTRPPQDRKFACPKCDKRFFTPKDLRRHENTHLGLREHVCPSCQTRFGRKDHLTRHAKKSCQAAKPRRPQQHTQHQHHNHTNQTQLQQQQQQLNQQLQQQQQQQSSTSMSSSPYADGMSNFNSSYQPNLSDPQVYYHYEVQQHHQHPLVNESNDMLQQPWVNPGYYPSQSPRQFIEYSDGHEFSWHAPPPPPPQQQHPSQQAYGVK